MATEGDGGCDAHPADKSAMIQIAVGRRNAAGVWVLRCPNKEVLHTKNICDFERQCPGCWKGIRPTAGYSVRNAMIGLTYVARRAGRKQASRAAPASIKVEM